MTLDQLLLGEHATIVAIHCPPVMKRRLMELGLFVGSSIQKIATSPLGDPHEFQTGIVTFSLRGLDAKMIDITLSKHGSTRRVL